MPNSLPDFQIQNFLFRHTHPLPISSLPTDSPSDQKCLICHIAYSNPPPSYVHPDCPGETPE
ncbi:hypothetical protein CC86DRAFT_255439, partial [Ophiobolus disseminans]